jgi:SOS-response transcriptional repressor LexA
MGGDDLTTSGVRTVVLTVPQMRLLRWLVAYVRERGVPPTLSELADGLGFASKNTPRATLRILERRGLVGRYPKLSRGVFVTKLGYAAAGEGNA